MSFLTELTVRRPTLLQAVVRKTLVPLPIAAGRSFSSTIPRQKSPVDAAKDGLKKVDRAVSDKIVDGIDAGVAGANKVKEVSESFTAGDAKGKAKELEGEAKGKAQELKGKAKGAAEEVKGKL